MPQVGLQVARLKWRLALGLAFVLLSVSKQNFNEGEPSRTEFLTMFAHLIQVEQKCIMTTFVFLKPKPTQQVQCQISNLENQFLPQSS